MDINNSAPYRSKVTKLNQCHLYEAMGLYTKSGYDMSKGC